jgi:hypothetical protein
LNPRNDLVAGDGSQNALASIGQTYLVYTTSTKSARLSLGGAEVATYAVRRFDPRTGQYSELPSYTGTDSIPLSAPDEQDWVYVVQKADTVIPN